MTVFSELAYLELAEDNDYPEAEWVLQVFEPIAQLAEDIDALVEQGAHVALVGRTDQGVKIVMVVDAES